MKRKEKFCFKENAKKKVDQEVVVHKNDLYGNMGNLEEWKERYDTKIVDTNTYYDNNYTGYQYEYYEDKKDKTESKGEDSRNEKQDQKSKL